MTINLGVALSLSALMILGAAATAADPGDYIEKGFTSALSGPR